MNTIAERSFLKSQIVDLDRLIELTGDDPLMTPGLVARKAEFERRLGELPTHRRLPQSTFYFSGGPVRGSKGIDAEFTSKVLDLVQEITTFEFLHRKHGVLSTRGRVAQAPEAKLMLTALPRGSFGLELRPANEFDMVDGQLLGDALQHFTDLLGAASESDAAFETALADAPVRVLPKLKKFFDTLQNYDAQLRLVTGDRELELNKNRVGSAVERVQATGETAEEIVIDGFYRGATLESRKIDFRTTDQQVITARLADEISEQEIGQLTLNQRLQPTFRRIAIQPRGGSIRYSYELLTLTSPAEPLPVLVALEPGAAE